MNYSSSSIEEYNSYKEENSNRSFNLLEEENLDIALNIDY